MDLSCTPCETFVPSLSRLEAHQQTLTAPTAFNCSNCDKTFTKSSSLNLYQNTHTGMIFACSQCDKSFFLSSSLKQHQCIQARYFPCDKSFSKPDTLNRHHTQKKPFSCFYCVESFSCKDDLKTHERNQRFSPATNVTNCS